MQTHIVEKPRGARVAADDNTMQALCMLGKDTRTHMPKRPRTHTDSRTNM